jgi:hypothetical protein
MAGASIIVTTNGRSFKVFVNPDQSQLQKIGNVIRFIADGKTKTLYVWDYNAGLHTEVSSELKLGDTPNSVDYLKGSARKRNDGSYAMRDSQFLKSFVGDFTDSDKKFLSRILNQNWSWVNPHIRVTEWLSTLKEALTPYFSHLGFE